LRSVRYFVDHDITMATRVTALALVLALAAGQNHKWAGVNFVAEGFEGPLPYDAPASLASLAAASALGVNTVALSFPWYTASINSTALPYRVEGPCPSGVPFNNASSPHDTAVITAVRAARGLGMRVILRPIIDPDWNLPVNRGQGRGRIGAYFGDGEWAAWFASYRVFLLHWAAVAAAEHVEVLCVGAELSATEKQDAAWRATIAAVRAVYSGIVYYSATGSDLSWWDASDWIAQDMYPALTNASADPALVSVDELVAAWGTYLAFFKAMGTRHNRSVLLQETGICSIGKAGLYNKPWFYDCYTYPVNEDVQAKYYESIFRAPFAQDWVTGALFWKWGAQGGPNDQTFFPLNKSAALVMKAFLGGM
jgi:hypothetical protein